MRDHAILTDQIYADILAAEPDTDDSAGIMLGMVVVAHLIATAAAGAALVFGAGWLAALLIHMSIGAGALLGAAVIVAYADRLRRAVRPATALLRAGRRLARAV